MTRLFMGDEVNKKLISLNSFTWMLSLWVLSCMISNVSPLHSHNHQLAWELKGMVVMAACMRACMLASWRCNSTEWMVWTLASNLGISMANFSQRILLTHQNELKVTRTWLNGATLVNLCRILHKLISYVKTCISWHWRVKAKLSTYYYSTQFA